MGMNKPTQDITVQEIKEAIKRLKRGKAMGLNQISNEICIEADTNTIEMYCEVLNSIAKTKEIPHSDWQEK